MVPVFEWVGRHPHFLVLVLGAVFTFLWLLPFRKRLEINVFAAIVISIIHVIIGMFSVSLFAAMENPKDYSLGMVSIFGAVFFMPLAYWLGARITKRSTREVFDIFVICLLFTLMCSRFNCLLSGCCLGRPISFLRNDSIRWPTRELEIIFYLVFILWCAPKVLKGNTSGELYPVYMIAYGIFRFLIETVRESNSSSVFHVSHLWAAISLLAGLCTYYEIKQNTMKGRR